MCFWLYSSGSTGAPKGTVHLHSHLILTAELYAVPVLGIRESDVVFSAAKLFFAYGLGNALTFPLAVGATTILMAERPTPDAVFKRLVEHKPTIFYGVPTLYAALAGQSRHFPIEQNSLCVSAPPPAKRLPPEIGKRWTERTGTELLDGIGSTEMLHIFLSNRPGDVRPGTTGKAVPGYELTAGRRAGQRHHQARRARRIADQRPDLGDHVLEPTREDQEHLPGSLDPQRRQVQPRQGRLLRLRRALGRHAEGERDLCLAGRGGGCAGFPRGGARGSGGRGSGRAEADQAQGVRRLEAREIALRCLEELLFSSTSRTSSRRTSIRAGSNSSASCPRPQPEKSRGSSFDEEDQPHLPRHPPGRQLAGREQAARARRGRLGEDHAIPVPERGLVRGAERVRGASAPWDADGYRGAGGRARASRPYRRARHPEGGRRAVDDRRPWRAP